MKTDIQIAQENKMTPIGEIAEKIDLNASDLIPYGDDKAKVNINDISQLTSKSGKLILVTAINPTSSGEGKTTMSIGLADGLTRLGKKTALALREPSLGPVFGMKGGAAGGGYAQVVPMEDLNLHFTGDIHAIGAANNLIAAAIDNHLKQGNALNIDPRRISWRRSLDMNDRQLRHIISGLGGIAHGVPREDGFDITVASEIMAILCLAESIQDLKERIARAVIGLTYDRQPVTVGDLKVAGAATVLLKDALKPNLVQTLEGTPAFVHGGPFANIAHGCNSVLATKVALNQADYVVTEAGFGADLGAEKFFDIKCRLSGLEPDAVVIVATIKALKLHGGADKKDLEKEDLNALEAGLPNLEKHIENIKDLYGQNTIVALNTFESDTEAEIQHLKSVLAERGVELVQVTAWADGGQGAETLAEKVVTLAQEPASLHYPYDLEDSIADKIDAIVQKVYGGQGTKWSNQAKNIARRLEKQGYGDLPICMAKTQYSLSDDPAKIGRPKDFEIEIKNLTLSAGAGFIVVLTGDVMKMPGLPKVPAAEQIDIDEEGRIIGLF